MRKEESLVHLIETARQQLCDLEQLYGLAHFKVLNQSMMLDELINQYNRAYYAQTKSRLPRGGNQLVSEELLPDHSHPYYNIFVGG
ncbi:hypothetical protein J2T13_002969 [Paenibacillus sp. DS2015]|uniref:aspartyl-phosphate phosphatase Spo0E family protein n=1 Tax=Paenibacillus sp. DS2015 TaxID=3373917 RepID=UPI003D1EF0C7